MMNRLIYAGLSVFMVMTCVLGAEKTLTEMFDDCVASQKYESQVWAPYDITSEAGNLKSEDLAHDFAEKFLLLEINASGEGNTVEGQLEDSLMGVSVFATKNIPEGPALAEFMLPHLPFLVAQYQYLSVHKNRNPLQVMEKCVVPCWEDFSLFSRRIQSNEEGNEASYEVPLCIFVREILKILDNNRSKLASQNFYPMFLLNFDDNYVTFKAAL